MKKICLTAVFVASFWGVAPGQHHHGDAGSSPEKSSALAALLSLQPMPIDLGGFYAGNWERGIIYTVAEVALFVPSMILLSHKSEWWDHHSYNGSAPDGRTWTAAERRGFYYLLGGYVLIKAISAFDAGYCVERRNAAVKFGYDRMTKSVTASITVPLQ